MAGSARKKMYCPECNTLKLESDFYRTNNPDKNKYPNGKIPICKRCRTMMLNNWKEETIIDLIEECDVPWVPQEWNKLLEKFATDPADVTGMTIMGRYLSKMQLNQYSGLRWKDTELYQLKLENAIREAMIGQGFPDEDIEKAIIIDKTLLRYPGATIPPLPTIPSKTREVEEKQTPTLNVSRLEESVFPEEPIGVPEVKINNDGTVNNYEYIPNYFEQEDDISYEDELTQEDKKFLRLKWGKTYSTEELVRLEKLYREMEESFDIQNAGHRDTLVKVCKTSLKSEQLLDIGDIDNAQKAVKMYEALMKAGNFTAVQNKTETGNFVDSISEIVEMCEKQGYIERLYVEEPKDRVDLTLMDMQRYTSELVKGETNLTNLVETALKQNMKDDEESKNKDIKELSDEDLFADLDKEVLSDNDFSEFYDAEEENELLDEVLTQLGGINKKDLTVEFNDEAGDDLWH